jgi:hypothetical protein
LGKNEEFKKGFAAFLTPLKVFEDYDPKFISSHGTCHS